MSYDLGDTVPLTVEVRDAAGALANAGAMALTVTKPDGTVDSPSPANPSTGIYQVDYAPSTAGPYRVRWVGTGANAAGYTDAFDVRDANPALMFSLADAKSILNISSTTFDAKIRPFIESTTTTVEYFAGAVVRRSVSERYDISGYFSSLVLRTTPVISVQTIVSIMLGGLSYSVTDTDLDGETGILQNKNGKAFIGPLRITYTAGRITMPAGIRDAGRLILKDFWKVQTGPGGLPRVSEQGADQGKTFIPGLGFSLPNNAISLLQPYLRAGKFA